MRKCRATIARRNRNNQSKWHWALAAGESPDDSTTGYRDLPGFCKSASLDEIAEHGYVLTPGRYVGAEEVEDDGVPFAEKMEGLTRELATQFHESEKLQAAIREPRCLPSYQFPSDSDGQRIVVQFAS